MGRRRSPGAAALPALDPDDVIPWIVGRVARAYGRSWEAQYEAYWHDTLLALYALDEVERIEKLEEEHRDLMAAFRAGYSPQQLLAEQRAFRARLATAERAAGGTMTDADVIAFHRGLSKRTGPH